MHARRLACFLFGLWLAGGLLMAWVATQNLEQVDRLLFSDPASTVRWKQFGGNPRPLMRYQASEFNRSLLQSWDNVQLGLGFAFLVLMLFWSHENKVVLGGLFCLLCLTAVQRFVLDGELAALGRMLDFSAPDANPHERTQFSIAHSAYVAVEIAKWLTMLALTASMVFSAKRSGRSRDSRHEFDRVDKRYHRSVDR